MVMPETIAICGAGSWGRAIAGLLDGAGHRIRLWAHDTRDFESLQKTGRPFEQVGERPLSSLISLSQDIPSTINRADLIVLATPSQYLRPVIRAVAASLDSPCRILNLAKGIEAGSLKRMSEVIADETFFPAEFIATLSGPSLAEEVSSGMPTTVVAAGVSREFVGHIQSVFSIGNFRVYGSEDLIGVELGGSLKNIIAIAAGIVDGLHLGDNTKGALITRGLAEMTRLGTTLGAQAATFAGLSGIGDLVTTCSSLKSRNRTLGFRIGKGEQLAKILSSMTMVAEGVETARSAYQLAQREKVEMPITNEMYRVLFEAKPAAEAVADLMGRALKAEIWQ